MSETGGLRFEAVARAFPPLAVCIAYGSGVIAQAGYSVCPIQDRFRWHGSRV
jgi:hypothetical protein